MEVHRCAVKKVMYRHHGFRRGSGCDAVISTIPLPDLLKTFPEDLVEEVVQNAERLKYCAIRFMNVLVDIPDVSGNIRMYVSEKKYIMTRIQESRRRSPFNIPDGKMLFMLEIPCNVNDDMWNRWNPELLERCLTGLYELGIAAAQRMVSEKPYTVYAFRVGIIGERFHGGIEVGKIFLLY